MKIKKELLLQLMELNYKEWNDLVAVLNYYFEKEKRKNENNLYLNSNDVLQAIDRGWNIPFPIQLQTEEK